MKRVGWAALGLVMGCTGSEGSRVDDVLALDGDATNGADVFGDTCAVCHGDDGSGGSGPDLTGQDSLETVISSVLNGNGSMPAFDGDLTDQEIADVAAYVTGGF